MKKNIMVIGVLTILIGLTGMAKDKIQAYAAKRFSLVGSTAVTEDSKVNRIREKAAWNHRFEKLEKDLDQAKSSKENKILAQNKSEAKIKAREGCFWVASDGTGDFVDIQSAVKVAASGDSICVTAGTYVGSDDFVFKWHKKDLKILGGFQSVAGPRTQMGQSIIDGESKRHCVATNDLSKNSEISGFTFTRCEADRGEGDSHRGAAMLNNSSDLVIKNNIFENNHAVVAPAIFNIQSHVTIDQCLFRNNVGERESSAIFDKEGSPVIVNSVFFKNIVNSFKENSKFAGVVVLSDSAAKITNATFALNSYKDATIKPSAVIFSNNAKLASIEIINSILRDGGKEILKLNGKSKDPIVEYSNIQGGFPGIGNIDLDPMFVDVLSGDLGLLSGSPSIDSGAMKNAPLVDIFGNPRPSGRGIDMGAYEFIVLNLKAAVALSMGDFHSCALLKDNSVHCWGSNTDANGMPLGQGQDFALSDPSLTIKKITSGRDFNCILRSDGNVQCIGNNDFGQIDFLNRFKLEVVDLDAGTNHVCAILKDGYVDCWGSNYDEYGNFSGQSVNFSPEDPNAKAVKIASGGYHSCTLLDNGQVHCWGSNNDIIPSVSNQSAGFTPADPNVHVVDVSAGEFHSCALLDNGSVHCWGSNNDASSLEISNQGQDYVPSSASLKAVAITSGGFHNCALLANGSVHCWGWNALGQADDFTPSNPAFKIVDVDAGFADTCFLFNDGSVTCQGWNGFGQADSYKP